MRPDNVWARDMSHDVLIFAVEGDHDAAAALAAATPELDPIICAVTATQASLRTGGHAAVACVWSSRAHEAGLAPVLRALCAQYPRATVLWRLDDTPWPEHEPIDPMVVVIGPAAQGPDANAAAGAVRLAVRRTDEIFDTPAPSPRREAPLWPALAIGVMIIGGLSAAGAAAWLSAPTRPKLTVAAPFAAPPAIPAPQAPEQPPLEPSSATDPTSDDALRSTLGDEATPQADAVVAPSSGATATATSTVVAPRAPTQPAQPARAPSDNASGASRATGDDPATVDPATALPSTSPPPPPAAASPPSPTPAAP